MMWHPLLDDCNCILHANTFFSCIAVKSLESQ